MPRNRTNGSPRKASWIALRDRGTAALGCREGDIMTFDYRSPAELSPPSVGVVRANGLAIVASPQQRRLFVSQWKSSPQCAPSARGCWSVTSASTARKSIACMRVMIILWDAERVNT